MKTVSDKVTVKMTGIDGKEVSIEKPVSFVELENVDDLMTFAGGSPENLASLLGAANYGFNLKARAKVTAQIKQENQGPEVAITRFVKQLVANGVKNGKPITEDAARARVLANAELFGIDLTSSQAA